METFFKNSFTLVGNIASFSARFFKEIIKPGFEFKEFIRQCFIVGYQSLPLVTITGFIMGLVLTIQSRPAMARFGAESWIPGMVSLSLIREIAPVITALICAGRVSSGIGAELGSMKVTEQIDAMEVSAINPYRYLVVTRTMATTFMIPILVIYADLIGIIGGFIGINIHSENNIQHYFSHVFESLEYVDILPATIKTFFFGFFIGIIGCFEGFNASGGTKSVGKAANSAVVSASLMIFIIDLIAVQVTDLFFEL
ncbi:MlaE family ABC transporter permease [Chryseobacterium daecheongense]|jgi:phospholipid/cholesterol/gamma-HCH transport system permease protein|uniref:ABC transporter permease n=1 Tax=Chryseobacterium daecheongense TaxID=192389 RepID=A0A3N0W493_9FLAO|nr:ABC transporter permease [Chryseobacterium daecheongense]ROH99794.1 ABC transporter permease [Chryseobacterium daecheongense]TDX95277.1 phospholipid/cholesterol/gamma-HCH transport system permease protein [Chryseobacterium daecheongense]